MGIAAILFNGADLKKNWKRRLKKTLKDFMILYPIYRQGQKTLGWVAGVGGVGGGGAEF